MPKWLRIVYAALTAAPVIIDAAHSVVKATKKPTPDVSPAPAAPEVQTLPLSQSQIVPDSTNRTTTFVG